MTLNYAKVLAPLLLGAAVLALGFASKASAQETIGGGTVTTPAVGPAPSYGIGGPNMVLVKNWHFGTGGTIKNYADMSANFFYHDQFGTIGNGTNYGAVTVAPDAADALYNQPVEGVNSPPVRQFTADSLKTFLTPLNSATTVDPNQHNAGCGSFMAQWKLPNGGSLLGRDIVWETRVRYVTPPYFWFALWTAGNQWNWNNGAQGAEQDLIESFGYDNGGGYTNYDGRYWHSNSVATPGKDTVDYSNWGNAMASLGIASYDATQYHTWTWVYKKDDTFAMYVDGVKVQSGSDYHWTFGNQAGQTPIDMDFLFDAGWGHTQVQSVDHPLPASAFAGKYYEFNYSRVYLSGNSPAPGTLANGSFETPSVGTGSGAYQYNPAGGGWTFGGNSGIQANGSAWGAATAPDGSQTAFLQSNPAQGSGAPGSISQSVNFPAAGTYQLTFQAARRGGQVQPVQVKLDNVNQGGTVAPVGSAFSPQSVLLTVGSAGAHTLSLSATVSTGDNSTFIDKAALAPYTSPLIRGTVFSDGAGSWHGITASAAAAAFDGSTNTFYDCTNATGYVGIDAGTAASVSKVVFAPRAGYEKRMVGGVFEGSNTSATTGYTTLAAVTATPAGGLTNLLPVAASGKAYRWLRYRDSQRGNCNVAEIQFLH